MKDFPRILKCNFASWALELLGFAGVLCGIGVVISQLFFLWQYPGEAAGFFGERIKPSSSKQIAEWILVTSIISTMVAGCVAFVGFASLCRSKSVVQVVAVSLRSATLLLFILCGLLFIQPTLWKINPLLSAFLSVVYAVACGQFLVRINAQQYLQRIFKTSSRIPFLLTLSGIAFYATYLSYYSILEHRSLLTFDFDLGVHENVLWNILNGNGAWASAMDSHFDLPPLLLSA